MTDIQENKISMYLGVRIIFNSFTGVFESVVEFKDSVGLFNTSLDDILAVQAIQELDRTGITISKSNLADNLIASSIKVRNAVSAHGSLNNNPELVKNVSFTDSELKHSRDVELYQRSGIIHDTAATIIARLEPFGVIAADLAELQTLRSGYLGIIGEPRIATVVRASATKLLVTKFRTTDKILRNTLDMAVRGFGTVSPDFVSQYKGARIIVDLGHRSTGSNNAVLEGIIRHFETLALLPGAVVTVVETGQSVTVGADAKFRFVLDKGGIYTLSVELAGYQTYTEDGISMQPGNELNLEIELEPLESSLKSNI